MDFAFGDVFRLPRAWFLLVRSALLSILSSQTDHNTDRRQGVNGPLWQIHTTDAYETVEFLRVKRCELSLEKSE